MPYLKEFNNKYLNFKIKYSNLFHDRFIIIYDILYHLGASLKDLGMKCFAINKIESIDSFNRIIDVIENKDNHKL